MGLVILIGGLLALRPLMRLLGSSETMLPYSCDYARYILLGAPIMCVSYELSSVLRSEGEASLAMIGLCTGSVLNIGLDPLLIFTCGLGISGAAIATVISQTVSMLILLSFFLRGKSIVRLNLLHVSRRFSDYLLIVSTGLPTICRQGLMSVATAMLNVQSGVYGDAAVAAMTITNKVYMICRHIVMGIGQGFQPVAGYNYGAGKKARVKEAFGFALMVGTVICLITGSLVFLYRTQIVGWFRNDPDVISIASRALLYTSYIVPVLAYSTYVNHLYQSLGFRKQATLLAACRQGIMFFPLIFTLPRLFGLDGVLFVQPAADFLTFLVSIPFQIWFFKKQLRADASGCAQPS
jgi:putative MATE family efflux protein